MKVAELLKNIHEGKLEPVYLVLGKEDYNSKRIAEAFVKAVPEDQRTVNIGQYDMENTSISEAIGDALSAPFFGDRRIVFIKHPYFLLGNNKKVKNEQNIDELIDYLENPEPTTIFVIFAPYDKLDERKKLSKKLLKKAVVVENGFLDERSTKNYVKALLQKKGYLIEPQALELLVRKTEAKLSLAMNELPKLLLLAQKDKKITESMVARMVPQTLEQNIFDLSDLVLAKQVKKSIDMYHNLILQHEEPLKINAILLGQIRLLLQVNILQKHGYAQGNIASSLKVHPYRVKLAMKKSREISRTDLRTAYLGLVDLEEKMKSTQREPLALFELFMLGYFKEKHA
ncbi:DNA polymerase III subunit delta [Liquorilactobacillus aquaticus DSM 21051]|uniref:DNA polymerase III subunit delta n=1 Tax=Liquorilactobacillus aquaticus DSM 21051 TaxID=1423725 RepID=A0A0R2CYY2_9LACO|nr:DNA polymerase III subunit delta [Liquorilactobacillus aquaticus]KRM96498.1 DNA polymerase III subunit delta [Liquorilactobacillus aquaticus DSM 21051]